MYKAEIRPKDGVDRVCCCDKGGGKCKPSLTEFSQSTTCGNAACDTYFNVSLIDYEDFAFPDYSLSDVLTGGCTITDNDFQIYLSDAPSEPVRMHVCKNDFALLATGLATITEYVYIHENTIYI